MPKGDGELRIAEFFKGSPSTALAIVRGAWPSGVGEGFEKATKSSAAETVPRSAKPNFQVGLKAIFGQ
jgi:hypothetical protein